ncbi:hypothetical protein [Cohnella lupini]|uniref:Short subunit dehydrogenase n=1 Tax=Cohnella lupini TaxID=1294267 RepID=A0A3D9IXI7_9BACL|nr:hypothetical protein [Cohnella lupini]RED66327.1 hypothetical protein DFP95_101826 [Cohnella lupini]
MNDHFLIDTLMKRINNGFQNIRKQTSTTQSSRPGPLSPGMTATDSAIGGLPSEYKDMITKNSGMTISPDSVARAIAYAIREPDEVGVNEITIRPTLQAI